KVVQRAFLPGDRNLLRRDAALWQVEVLVHLQRNPGRPEGIDFGDRVAAELAAIQPDESVIGVLLGGVPGAGDDVQVHDHLLRGDGVVETDQVLLLLMAHGRRVKQALDLEHVAGDGGRGSRRRRWRRWWRRWRGRR